MNNFQEILFQTIDTITESKINKIKFDKTIEAIVTSDEKRDVGEYELKYQDLLFTAYSSSNTIKFGKDDNVLVLIPDGDMSKRKTIISSSKKEGETYVDFEQIIDRFGINFVDEADGFEINLSTTSDETISFKLKNQLMIDQYPDQKFLAIGAELYTNINPADTDGSYGIAIDCIMLNDDGERLPYTFEFNNLHVTGNPFQARGYKETIIPLAMERLFSIVGARAFSKGFTAGNEKIKFKKISVEYVNVREQDKSVYSGNIVYPKGLHFRANTLYPDERLPLIMEFKQQSQVLDTEAINYKWFVMNGEVISVDDPKYHPDAGFGWEWIKTGDYDENLITGAGTKSLEVAAAFVPNFSTFKCIAEYKDKNAMVSSMVTFVDHTEAISINIDSSNGVSFINGIGSTTLTCTVTQNSTPIEDTIIYEWTQIKEDGTPLFKQKGFDNTLFVSASELGLKSNYICEVSLEGQNRPFGTGQMTLLNVTDGRTQGVVIVGGFRTALYDADGVAPENLIKEGFQFDVYENGDKVVDGIDWTWYIPNQSRTLLDMSNPTMEDDGRRSSKEKVLFLDLIRDFDFNKNDNTVTIEVMRAKDGVQTKLIDTIGVSITKVGSNGADGAAGKPGIDGNTYVYEIQGGSPTLIYNGLGENPQPAELNQFIMMFSENGNMGVIKDVDQVEWTLPSKNTCLLSFIGTTARVISTYKDGSENPHKVTLVADAAWSDQKFNNYISAKITYKEMIFRETYPIAVTKNGQQGEKGDGYRIEVISSNGVIFKNGVINTELTGKVYNNELDITDTIDEQRFIWTKINSDGTVDEDWSIRNPIGKKTILITEQDIIQRGTFILEIV